MIRLKLPISESWGGLWQRRFLVDKKNVPFSPRFFWECCFFATLSAEWRELACYVWFGNNGPIFYGEENRPTISVFYGILIQMFWDEHAPPHFHASYGEYKATIDIQRLVLAEGALPRRATQLVLDWAELNQQALLEDWMLCQAKQHPKPIAPLK